jgi:hypothetical protein
MARPGRLIFRKAVRVSAGCRTFAHRLQAPGNLLPPAVVISLILTAPLSRSRALLTVLPP